MELVRYSINKYNCLMQAILTRALYRILDIIVGFIGCCFTLFLCIVVKLVYLKHGDNHPIIFTQERIGKNGKLFKMYKFRTMIPNADQVLFDLMATNEEIKKEYEKNKKLENDPRITKFGAKLRKCSIDEFPQFFNVLKGEMTLVGPRPYLPRERKDMRDAYDAVILCKPALTGPWQIGGRSDINFKERCKMDVNYVQTKTFKNDLDIFVKTITTVINKEGAL